MIEKTFFFDELSEKHWIPLEFFPVKNAKFDFLKGIFFSRKIARSRPARISCSAQLVDGIQFNQKKKKYWISIPISRILPTTNNIVAY